jgi:hypothetical protein
MACSELLLKRCTALMLNCLEGWVIDDSEGCAEGIRDLC